MFVTILTYRNNIKIFNLVIIMLFKTQLKYKKSNINVNYLKLLKLKN